MTWNVEQITSVAVSGAPADHAAFEAVGLAEIPDAHVLDVGCLDGFNTRLKFAPYQNITSVLGIDPNAEGIASARKNINDPRFSWKVTDFEGFDTARESFDIIYLGHVFQHMPNRPESLKKMLTLLKPGRFVIIKTVDDSMKTSAPDPEQLMSQVFSLYEQTVRPNQPHTQSTDRNNGSKCYSLLKHAGFSAVRIGVFHTDTTEMTREEREAFFERMTYFRRRVPECCGIEAQKRMNKLMARWHELFLHDDYYFDSPTVMAIGRKPFSENSDAEKFVYRGPLFGRAAQAPQGASNGRWRLSPLTEDDLGEVMAIETSSFPDPWTPLAYACELRYNPQAHYITARDETGMLCGYAGWWYAPDAATIAHIAVAEHARRSGLGRIMVEYACEAAARAGKSAMQLQVRKGNSGAQAFYQALGFIEVETSKNYYTNPDDDGIIMVRMLNPTEEQPQ